MRDGAAHVTERIAVLQTAYEDGVHGRAGHHAKLTPFSNGTGEDPVGYSDPHPALNDERQCVDDGLH